MRNLLLFYFLLSATAGFCQGISCDFGTVRERDIRSDRKALSDFEDTELKLNAYLKSLSGLRTYAQVYTLPVVFHVITNGGAIGAPDNPSDASIVATLKLLNDAWNKNGSSYGGVDMQIKFALATRSSTCGSTSGINRVNGTGVANYSANGITTATGGNEAQVKDLSRWSSADYINIWIVTKINGSNTSPGGFAYFPEHADSRIDGITILAGTVDGVNKTIVHEMGHVFGLYHTFRVSDSDEINCPSPTDCANTGDMVCDTEPTKNVACGTASNECSGTNYAIADAGLNYTVLNNYMGYGTCQFMFTEGQKIRARGFLDLFRPGLINSKALSPVASVPGNFPLIAANGQSEYYGVERVKFGGIDIYSGTSLQDNGNLINRTCNQRALVTRGTSVPISVTSTYGNPEYLRVYIDYNNDGDFQDAGEGVASGDWVSSINENITIPASALTSVPLLMRVIADDVFGSPPSSTALIGNGQAEDFTVMVNAPLPVTLLYFKGALIEKKRINLTWATTAEDNSRAFILERGSDLITMQKLAEVDAAGNSDATKTYQFIDLAPLQGMNYYKLTEIDSDGSRYVFRAIAVETGGELSLFPNPLVGNQFFLQTTGRAKVKVCNVLGQEVFCEFSYQTPQLICIKPIQKLAAGMYFISMTENEVSRSIRMVVP